jgi:hypothetical protein
MISARGLICTDSHMGGDRVGLFYMLMLVPSILVVELSGRCIGEKDLVTGRFDVLLKRRCMLWLSCSPVNKLNCACNLFLRFGEERAPEHFIVS